ncbi:MAG: hypothetical protein CMF96_12480 [Candidatus Marinimicrobia bacterium]|nr:hypothetical protein [Candidatus Neomarinimicrobiota bacterium]
MPTSFSLDQLTDSNDNFRYRPDPMINNIEVTSNRKKAYKPLPAPPTRRQLTGWTVEQVGPQMWRVFRNSTTQGKQAVIDYNTPEGAQRFADGCNGEHKNPTRMSAASLRNKNKEHLTEDDKIALAALKDGEGI